MERLHQGINRHRLSLLYCWRGNARTWARVRKAIQRAGAKFLKVSTGDGRDEYTVLCTKPLEGTEAIEPAIALERLAAALRSVPLTRGRPVTCSADWLPPVRQDRRWRYAGDIPASDQHFDATLRAEADAGHLRAKILEPKVAAAWQFSADVPEEERVSVRERLFGQTLPVNADLPGEASGDTAPPAGRAG
jgi:hypothetical protein